MSEEPERSDPQIVAECACGRRVEASRYAADAYRCPACGQPLRAAVVTSDARYPLYTPQGLYRELSAIAAGRNGQVGQRYLARERPDLLANCRVHAGSYRAARRRLRRWLGRHGGSPPPEPPGTPQTYPRWSVEETAPSQPDPEIVVTAERVVPPEPEPEPPEVDRQRVAEIAVRIASRSARLDERCPYCHDVFEDADQDGEPDHAYLCACGALLHLECRLELDRCTTLGCSAPFVPQAEPRPEVHVREVQVALPPRATGGGGSALERAVGWVVGVGAASFLTWLATELGTQERRVGWPIAIGAWVLVALWGASQLRR